MPINTTALLVGQKIRLGWNGAKYFTESIAYEEVRVEAVGIDWIVIRDQNDNAHATGFAATVGLDYIKRYQKD